jgi:uncharacterized protein (DUF427 family)
MGEEREVAAMGSALMRSMYHERPDYRVDLLARTNVMTAWLGETCLARSNACLIADEQDHGLVAYFPRDAVDFSHLEPTDHHTVCPFKGQAVYWRVAGSEGTGIAWSYPEPFPEVARLAGYVAFDQDEVRVTIGRGTFTGVRP